LLKKVEIIKNKRKKNLSLGKKNFKVKTYYTKRTKTQKKKKKRQKEERELEEEDHLGQEILIPEKNAFMVL